LGEAHLALLAQGAGGCQVAKPVGYLLTDRPDPENESDDLISPGTITVGLSGITE
jgi:hypothetical protein